MGIAVDTENLSTLFNRHQMLLQTNDRSKKTSVVCFLLARTGVRASRLDFTNSLFVFYQIISSFNSLNKS